MNRTIRVSADFETTLTAAEVEIRIDFVRRWLAAAKVVVEEVKPKKQPKRGKRTGKGSGGGR